MLVGEQLQELAEADLARHQGSGVAAAQRLGLASVPGAADMVMETIFSVIIMQREQLLAEAAQATSSAAAAAATAAEQQLLQHQQQQQRAAASAAPAAAAATSSAAAAADEEQGEAEPANSETGFTEHCDTDIEA